ncbi:hypothetical protein N8390_09535 [Amylibacter sp.]|nr:hypothetical protein [Amylibacter sp.]
MKVISCYFGRNKTGVYEAPLDADCFFFSNNKDLERLAQKSGWNFIFVEDMPISAEPRVASLQSKFIKFLQFKKSLINWTPTDSILYFDHKFAVKSEHIGLIQNLCSSEILIRNTPKEKLSIQDEINAALPQKRYAEVMLETVQWINTKITKEKLSPNNRVMNTGLILYADVEKSQKLCDEVYEACWLLGQPECQIIWGLISQPYEGLITRIDWNDLDIFWKERSPIDFIFSKSNQRWAPIKRFLKNNDKLKVQ